MDTKFLVLADSYRKKREWNKAIEYYDRHLNEVNYPTESVYVSYSKCLIKVGKINQAEKKLHEAKYSHSTSERILKELIKVYQYKNERKNANLTAKLLVSIHPNKSENHFILGKTYAALKKINDAEISYISGIEYRHDMNMNDLLKKLQHRITKDDVVINSEYNFISGRSNYGAIIHEFNNHKYFTKISKLSTLAKREEVFYSSISEEFFRLKEYTPQYIDAMNMDGISYLTVEYIDSEPTNSEHLKEVIDVSQKLSSIPYKKMVQQFPNPNYSFQLKNKPNPITIFFTQIHKKEINEKLFSSFYKIMKENNYPKSIEKIIQHLELLIMDNCLYEFVDPNNHYSLLHGDFNRSNVRISKMDGEIKIIDWETFKIGPHFMDIVRYVTGLRIPFDDIKSIYLNDDHRQGTLTLIEKIFFLYSLILLYILTIGSRRIESYIDEYLSPALLELENDVAQFKQEEFGSVLHLLSSKQDNYKNKYKTVKRENEGLANQALLMKDKNKQLETKLNELLNSKSWKLTAPLRKLMQWRNK